MKDNTIQYNNNNKATNSSGEPYEHLVRVIKIN
jgi:hypothetical protein